MLDTSSPRTKLVMPVRKKRKLDKSVASESHSLASCEWIAIHKLYSYQRNIYARDKKKESKYRCTLCWDSGTETICTSKGDMDRHLQTKKHIPKSFPCSWCTSSFTRPDSQKRHMMNNSCNRGRMAWVRGPRNMPVPAGCLRLLNSLIIHLSIDKVVDYSYKLLLYF